MSRWRLSNLGFAAVLLATACTANGPTHAPAAAATSQPAVGCDFQVDKGPLPEWAREGFEGDFTIPHVMGRRGDILAAIFGYPLTEPQQGSKTNKILWVARVPPTGSGNLKIDAQLDGTDEKSQSEVSGGPGPSIIDVPRAGCWHLTLTWSGHTDSMDLVYEAGSPGPTTGESS